jgi:threonine/homoserine/homoserine lactone efflux protein
LPEQDRGITNSRIPASVFSEEQTSSNSPTIIVRARQYTRLMSRDTPVESLLEGLVAGYGIAIPVGAVAVLIVNTSIQCGFRLGFFAGAGAATADFIYAILAGAAGVALERLLRPVSAPLRIVSGAVLLLMAASVFWRGLRKAAAEEGHGRVCGPWHMYMEFLGITIINPLTVVYFTALILGSDPGGSLGPMEIGPFVLGVGVASLSWQTFLAGVGGILQGRLPRNFRRLTTLVGGLLVAVLGLRILVSAMLEYT